MNIPCTLILFLALLFNSTAQIIPKFQNITENQTTLKVEDVLEPTETTVSGVQRSRTIFATENGSYLNKYSFAANGFENSDNVKKCKMPAKCELLEERTCFGAKLPYTQTSMALSGFVNQQQAKDALTDLMSLQLIPRCWSVIQPFLCAILFPQCHNSTVQLPSKEMCLITKGPCNVIEEQGKWPEFLQCKENYPSKCKTASMDLPFNTSGECAAPLVSTKRDKQWYDGFKGCGVQCSHPLFTDSEHADFQNYIYLMAITSVCMCLFTLTTYTLDWRVANKYPGIIIFYINVCYLVAGIGFLLQFHKSFKSTIICHPDGTRRLNEPSDGDISCMVTFVMVYYFLMAAGIWFVLLGYTFNIYYKSFVSGKCKLKRQSSYFHLIAWSVPVVFTIIVIILTEVEGDSVVGICFLSEVFYVRIIFLLIPFGVMAITGSIFIGKALCQLVKVKRESSHMINEKINKKIGLAIIRLSLFVVCVFCFLAISIYFHVYTFTFEKDWLDSLKEFILCTSKITKPNDYELDCKVKAKPSLNVYKLHLFTFFAFGVTISHCFWNSNSVTIWKRFVRRKCGKDDEEGGHYSKREVIAHGYGKRKNFNADGRISISLRSLHSDGAGLGFDMNSMTSADTPSAWMAAIPDMMKRNNRMGTLTRDKRRNSIGSECSVQKRISNGNRRRISRRHSLDSQISFHVSDVERKVALYTAARFGVRRNRNFLSSRKPQRFFRKTRRGSNTSEDSNQGSMIFGQSATLTHDSLFTTMMKMVKTNSYSDHEPTKSRVNNSKGVGKVDDTPQLVKATVGVQTSLESIEQPHCIMVEKACQVSTPLLRKAAIQMDLSGSNSSVSSFETERIKV